jgi:hypothetical protein
MAKLSVSKAWDDTRGIFARDGSLLTAVALALLVLPQIIVGLVAVPGSGSITPVARLVWIAAALIGVLGQIAIVRLALGHTTVGDAIEHGARRFLPILGSLLILACALALVIIPLMVALLAAGMVAMPVEGQAPPPSFGALALALALVSLLLSVKFTMIVPVASEERAGPLQILKRSWYLTRGHYWRLLGFLLIVLVTAIVLAIVTQSVGGIVAKLVGGKLAPFTLGSLVLALIQAVVSAALTTLFAVMAARIYRQLAGGQAQASVPSSGT